MTTAPVATCRQAKAAPGPIESTLFPPDSLAARERAALADADRLAELWDRALRASFQLGYDAGHRNGVRAGRAEEGNAWQAIITGFAADMKRATHAELVELRRPTHDPCATRCGSCSQCIHADAAARNRELHGEPSHPGQQQPPHARPRPPKEQS